MLIPFCLTAAQPRAFGAPDPFEHLDALFRYAQLLTADAEQAAALVEATYRQAQTSERPVRDRTDLLNLLTIVHRERMERPAGPVPPAATALHRRLARAYAETVLPRLFAALPDDDRLVLHLRAVEQLSWAEAGRLLGTTAAMAEARFERAVAALHRHLYAGASPADRRLLDQGLEAEDVPRILAQTLAAHLTPVPPTLRPRVAAALHTPAEPTRPTPPARTPPPAQSRARRAVLVLLLILTAALIGYGSSTLFERTPEVNLIALSARQAGLVRPSVQSHAPEAVERYIRDRLGWRVVVPDIEGTALIGVDIREVAPGVEVPVLLYQDHTADLPIALFTYTYALLNQYEDRIRLAPEILRNIERDRSFDLQRYENDTVLIWRHRDDIFVAVTPLDDPALPDRISFPS